jgi:hypothetical protein
MSFWMMVPLSLAAVLSAASGEITSPCGAGAMPSGFDYVVLASMADAPHPIALVGFCPVRQEDRDSK